MNCVPVGLVSFKDQIQLSAKKDGRESGNSKVNFI